MSSIFKLIMHGLASGKVRSTPQVLAALKELNPHAQGSASADAKSGAAAKPRRDRKAGRKR
jgi:hypothetical protein